MVVIQWRIRQYAMEALGHTPSIVTVLISTMPVIIDCLVHCYLSPCHISQTCINDVCVRVCMGCIFCANTVMHCT